MIIVNNRYIKISTLIINGINMTAVIIAIQ